MVDPDMCDFQRYLRFVYVLFSLEIHRENVKLGPTIGNFEGQKGVSFE